MNNFNIRNILFLKKLIKFVNSKSFLNYLIVQTYVVNKFNYKENNYYIIE